MYYNKLSTFYWMLLLKNTIFKFFFVYSYITSIYPFLPPVLMYIIEFHDSVFLRTYSIKRAHKLV